MSKHRDGHLELCAAYVLGALDDADRRELEGHLETGCEVCERELVRLEQGARLIAASSPPATPPASLKARTMAAIAASDRPAVAKLETRRPSSVPMMRWALATAASVAIVSSFLLLAEGNRLRGELAAAQKLLAQREQELADQSRWIQVLDGIQAQSVQLIRTPDGAPELKGRGVWDPVTRRAVIVFEHLTPPDGRDYQLWGLHPSGPRSLGVVRADSMGRAIVRLDDAGDPSTLEAFAISLEPAGGSPNPNAPTGPVVMVGRVGG